MWKTGPIEPFFQLHETMHRSSSRSTRFCIYSMHKSSIDLVSNLLWNVGINAVGLNGMPRYMLSMCVCFPHSSISITNVCEWFWIFGHEILLDYGLRWLEMKKSKSILPFDIRRKNQMNHFQSFILLPFDISMHGLNICKHFGLSPLIRM